MQNLEYFLPILVYIFLLLMSCDFFCIFYQFLDKMYIYT